MAKIKILFITFLILLILPIVYAGNYGAGNYGAGLYGVGEVSVEEEKSGEEDTDEEETVSPGGGGGGGGGRPVTEPEILFDVKILEFDAFEGEFIDQLFDITFSLEDSTIENSNQLEAIVTFESFAIKPVLIKLGDFFNFTYFIKGIGNISNDVKIHFEIEKDGKVISSGSDVIYMGSFEEKTETAKLFIPDDLASGNYNFIVQVNYGDYTVESHRTISITVNGDQGTAIPAIDLTFIILDKNKNEIYREEDSIVVETENILRKTFKGLNLSKGKYTLVLQTLYNADVFDEFKQDFEIKRGPELQFPSYIKEYIKKSWIWSAGLAAVFLISIIIVLIEKFRKTRIKIRKEHIDPNLLAYVNRYIEDYPAAAIKKRLLEAGWNEGTVDKALVHSKRLSRKGIFKYIYKKRRLTK